MTTDLYDQTHHSFMKVRDAVKWGYEKASAYGFLLQISFMAAIDLIQNDYMGEVMATIDRVKRKMVKEVK